MEQVYEQVYHFDFVHDTQAVFRQLLSAMAHPLEIREIEAQAAGFPWEHPELWAVCCTLLDNETGFYVEKDAELQRAIADLTLARHASLYEADYIVLSAQLNYDSVRTVLQSVKKGTLADPHISATVLISCAGLNGDVPLCAAGPGIKGQKTLMTTAYISRVCALWEQTKAEYPCGADLIFIGAKGELMALPRLCKTAGSTGQRAEAITADAERDEERGDAEWHM